MRSIRRRLQTLFDHRHVRHAKLPWAELEAEADRQGCSAADIFYDRAGHRAAHLALAPTAESDTISAHRIR
jgi:hypothetical protein